MPKKGYKDIKEDVIIKRTKKTFKDWRKILDKFNVKKNGHMAAANHLQKVHKVNQWWSHVIVVRYEYEKKIKRNDK